MLVFIFLQILVRGNDTRVTMEDQKVRRTFGAIVALQLYSIADINCCAPVELCVELEYISLENFWCSKWAASGASDTESWH